MKDHPDWKSHVYEYHFQNAMISNKTLTLTMPNQLTLEFIIRGTCSIYKRNLLDWIGPSNIVFYPAHWCNLGYHAVHYNVHNNVHFITIFQCAFEIQHSFNFSNVATFLRLLFPLREGTTDLIQQDVDINVNCITVIPTRNIGEYELQNVTGLEMIQQFDGNFNFTIANNIKVYGFDL